ncbi:uncharacterized protein LOC117557059 [Gymnodraco acuticeps]|uniref:Uncharacterized protein LOC117557059 n=2 Tax=Gymnodraco acuticeps TaxID=8218 RepID=A0A6P8WMB9_GYMAC|nr:uncharacterized protein LOC117557059 [Gymnodraco acuticeps]
MDTRKDKSHEEEEIGKNQTESVCKSVASVKRSNGSHVTRSSTHSRSNSRATSRSSLLSSIKRQEAAAEIAANEATLEVMLEQEQQIEELDILEAEAAQLRAKQIAEAAQLTAKQEAENAERQRQLQAKRRQLERLETVKKLKAAKARHQVYEQNACSDEEISELLHQHVPLVVKEELKHKSSELQNHSPPQAATQQKQEDSTSALIRALAESISASRLPVPEPTTFSGDPLRLNDWKVSFRTLVDRKNIPAEEKIYYLRKYVGGPAKKAIESYFLLGTESAYHAAWTILEERYGNPFLIAKAFRDKLDAWPKISSKDSVELQELSDFLRSCEAAMSQIKGLEVLNDCNENQRMLAKLPDWLTSSWNRKVTEMEEQNHTFPTLSQFVKFLTREAKIACNPITSLHALKSRESEKGKILRSPVSNVLTTETNETADATNCLFCEKAGHGLHKCYKFRNETISERVKFLQENKLCFGCLKSGHRSKECKNRKICETCEKGHPTCLHDNRTREERMSTNHDGERESTMERPQGKAASTPHEATSNTVFQNVKVPHTSTIVPVWVSATSEPHREILVYALLDTQSDTSFILEETAKALHTKNETVQLKLSTMASRNTVVSCRKLTGLQVRGIYSDRIIPLPVTYSREFIPANRDHIPTPETAKAWPHLEHLADEIAPQQSCDVGLLIGYNCSQALVPREVVPGEGNQPFAQGTDLGWSVVGFGNPCLDIGDMIGVSHQVTVKQVIPSLQSSNLPREVHYVCRTQIKEVSPADVVEVLESDFVERASEDNSADQASKGLTAQQLQASNGFTGPYLLWQKELPSGEVKVGEIVSSDPELKKAQVHDTQANEVKSLLDHLHKFSDWSRVVKAFARHKRLAKEIKGLKPRSCEATCLEERREAELTIIEMVQEATLSQEIKCLQQHKEYHLQQRPKWIKDRRNVKVNDVVILQDNTIPRGQWKLARVVEVYPGGDGRVRRLKLLISDSTLDVKGKRLAKPVYLERPIHKTVLLLEAD